MKIDFAYEKMSTKIRFEKEAQGNSEMAYFICSFEDIGCCSEIEKCFLYLNLNFYSFEPKCSLTLLKTNKNFNYMYK